jgi:hypothetical protein
MAAIDPNWPCDACPFGVSDEGVLIPEMARRVLRDKAEREARWQRTMLLWENIPEEGGAARRRPAH